MVLALGGGVARGAAHVGVIRALRRAGIAVAGVAGTSAGALVGAMLAGGLDEGAILERFVAFPSSPTYREMRRTFARARATGRTHRPTERYFRASSLTILSDTTLAALPGPLFDAFLSYFIGEDREIGSLAIPFCACATDLVDGGAVALGSGSLHAALRGSCAIPGMFPPQRDGERLLVDGSMVAEVPVAAARELGLTEPTLAVYLQRPVRRVGVFESSTEVAIRANALVHAELVREQLRHAPLLLSVPVDEVPWLAFRDAVATAAIGEAAAEAALPILRAALARLRR